MSKKVVANPAELTDLVVDNPDNLDGGNNSSAPRKNPKRVAAGYKSYAKRLKKENKQLKKELSNTTKTEDDMSRSNPVEDIANQGKSMVLKSIFAVGGSFTAAKVIGYFIDKYGDTLSEAVKRFVRIGAPIAGGATLAVYGKDSRLAQDAATGMVISGVSTGVSEVLSKVMPEVDTQEDLSDSFGHNYKNSLGALNVSPEDLLIKPNGDYFNAQTGRKLGNIQNMMDGGSLPSPASNANSGGSKIPDAGASMVGFDNFEETESWAA